MRKLLLALAAVVMVVSAGCSKSSPSAGPPVTTSAAPAPVTTTTVSIQAVAAQLDAAETQVSAADMAIQAKINATSTVADLETAIGPLETAIQKYISTLTSISWPMADDSDAHAVISTASNYLGILMTLSAQNAFSLATWDSQLSGAQQQERSAANILRHDLGLPPLPAPPTS